MSDSIKRGALGSGEAREAGARPLDLATARRRYEQLTRDDVLQAIEQTTRDVGFMFAAKLPYIVQTQEGPSNWTRGREFEPPYTGDAEGARALRDGVVALAVPHGTEEAQQQRFQQAAAAMKEIVRQSCPEALSCLSFVLEKKASYSEVPPLDEFLEL